MSGACAVTSEGALARFRRAYPDLGAALSDLNEAPFPTTIEVRIRRGRIEVRDRGVGVAPDERALVFDRFYRAAAARSQPGSGLGLAIVRQIAELHGGTVELLERAGKLRLRHRGPGRHEGIRLLAAVEVIAGRRATLQRGQRGKRGP